MWKKFVNDYLSFTKKDRVGVIVLVTLIFIVVLLPYIWPAKKPTLLPAAEIEQIKLLNAKLNNADTNNRKDEEAGTYNYPAKNYYHKEDYSKEKPQPFYFNPNTLDAAGWKRLGIRDRTAATIQNFLSKGGKFQEGR